VYDFQFYGDKAVKEGRNGSWEDRERPIGSGWLAQVLDELEITKDKRHYDVHAIKRRQ
jgi:hypothetical protein